MYLKIYDLHEECEHIELELDGKKHYYYKLELGNIAKINGSNFSHNMFYIEEFNNELVEKTEKIVKEYSEGDTLLILAETEENIIKIVDLELIKHNRMHELIRFPKDGFIKEDDEVNGDIESLYEEIKYQCNYSIYYNSNSNKIIKKYYIRFLLWTLYLIEIMEEEGQIISYITYLYYEIEGQMKEKQWDIVR